MFMPKSIESTPFTTSSGESKWLLELEKSNGPRPSQGLSNDLNRLDNSILVRIDSTFDRYLETFSRHFYQDDNCKYRHTNKQTNKQINKQTN